MSLTPTVDLRSRIDALNRDIVAGRIIEAMHEFHDESVRMQENADEPTIGREANIDRESRFLESVKEWKGYEVKAIAVTGETSFVESVIDFIDTKDQHVHLEQISVARWKNGRIVHERSYYDSAAR